MVILGVVLAVILVAIIGIIAFRVLGKDDEEDREPVQTEQDSGEDDKFIVRGEEDGDDSQVSPEENSEPTEAPVEESEEPAEPETRPTGEITGDRARAAERVPDIILHRRPLSRAVRLALNGCPETGMKICPSRI